MRHYVLTRSHRGPDYPLDANRRRIELLRRVTAASLSVQSTKWTWIVYINPADPLLDERLDAFASAGAPVFPITHTGEEPIDWSDDVLTTRIDDDDAFSRDAFRRLSGAVRPKRRVLMFPCGYRYHAGLVEPIVHRRNAWSSLFAPRGDQVHIRMAVHPKVNRLAPTQMLDNEPAWLWVRHPDAETLFRRATDPLTDEVKALYHVDWEYLEGIGS